MIFLTEIPPTETHFVSMVVVEVKGSDEKGVFSAADLAVASSPDATELPVAAGQDGTMAPKEPDGQEESIFPFVQVGSSDIPAVSRQYDSLIPKDLDGTEGSIFFLLGDPGTREFAEARKVLQDFDSYLVLMVVDDGVVSGAGMDLEPGYSEALIRVGQDDYGAAAVRVVRDLVLSFRLPGMMRPSRTDFRQVCSGRAMYPVFIDVSDMEEPASGFCNLPGITGLDPSIPSGYSAWYGAMFYSDEEDTWSLDHMAEVLDTIYSYIDMDGDGVGYASALICPGRQPFRITGLLAL